MGHMVEYAEQMIGSRYRLHESLGQGGMGTVYRATDRLTGQVVALKRVTKPASALHISKHSTFTNLQVSLANEFQALASLRHPNIIPVLDYGFADSKPYFTMRFIPNARSVTQVGAGLDHHGKVNLLLQILRALSYLHRRGIIHRDLKPENALVDEDGQLMVLDFGLAQERPEMNPTTDRVSGTLGYIAPEVLQGIAPSPASDLYAVGLIAYELFAGHHPYDMESHTALLQDILTNTPDLSALDVDAPLADLIERLLRKNPLERYQDAADIIEQLHTEQPRIDDDEAVLNSFLQAARFVGREGESRQLQNALEQAFQGKGSNWLIGGESGVGKSRLLNELRILALVRGGMVVTGLGLSSGSLPYELWRDPVRRLALAAHISDEDAAVLKEIAPDLDQLLEREIPTAPHIQEEAAQNRLIDAIKSLFRQFLSEKEERVIVLLLEDLHWMVESLDVLAEITSLAEELPLLIVGTYRSDEKPGLADRFPTMQHIHLERLSSTEIAQLSESMLGASGRGEDVLELLRRETEGNVFFLIETVRALAEEAGHLDNVGRMTLPPTVFAGGVQKVVERRLNQVPEIYHALLKCAAIAGRQIDLNVMQRIADVDVDDWLTVCANSAVLAVQEGRWRFAHDKLREGLLTRIEDQEMEQYSRQIAEAIEAVYPYDDSLAQILAAHWQNAGDTEKEAYYAYLAGRQQKIANPQEARVLLHRALSLMGEDHPNVADVYRMLGDVYISLSEHSLAQHYFETCLEIARKQNMSGHIARSLHGLGTIAERHAQYDIARERFEEGLRFAKENGQAELLALLLNGLGGVLLEEGHYDKARESLESSLQLALTKDDKPIITQNYNYLGVLCFRQGDLAAADEYFKQALGIRREAGMRQGIASSLNNLGVLATTRGRFGEALAYHQESYEIKKEVGDRYGMSTSIYNMAVAAMNLGQLVDAERYCREALALSNEQQHRGNVADCLNLLGMILLRRGEDLAESRGLLVDAVTIMADIGEPLGHALAQANLSDVLLKLGELSEAQQYLLNALRAGHSLGATQPIFRALMGMGKYYAQQGETERAVLLLSFVNLGKRCDEETRTDTEAALQTCVDQMSAERMVEMIQASKVLELDAVVQSILNNPADPAALIPAKTRTDETPTVASQPAVSLLPDDAEATIPTRPAGRDEETVPNKDRLEFPRLDEHDGEDDTPSASSDATSG